MRKTKSDHIFMAIPGSDFDRIEWIKTPTIEKAGEVLSDTLELNGEELEECDYRIFEVPDKEIFSIFHTDCISRVDTNFGAFKSYR